MLISQDKAILKRYKVNGLSRQCNTLHLLKERKTRLIVFIRFQARTSVLPKFSQRSRKKTPHRQVVQTDFKAFNASMTFRVTERRKTTAMRTNVPIWKNRRALKQLALRLAIMDLRDLRSYTLDKSK